MRPLATHTSAMHSALTMILIAAAWGGGDAGRGGTIVIGTGSEPGTLFPPLASQSQAREVTELVFDKLADLGPSANTLGDTDFQPRLAHRWTWSVDSLAVTFHLDPRARWHDGAPVRAGDVRFAFAVYTDTLVGARFGTDLRNDIDSVSVADSVTCTAWFRRRTPEQFYNLVSTVMPLPEHLLGRVPRDSLATARFTREPVGNGPFRFVRWDPAQRVEIAAVDGFFRGRPGLDRVIWTYSSQNSTLVQQLRAGESDFVENLPPAALTDSVRLAGVRVVRRGNYDYNFLRFNLRDGASDRPHRLFADKNLRRALTMALDRTAMVRSVFDSLGAVLIGPFVRAQWSSDPSLAQFAFDRADAARLLDSLGWRTGSDGIRSRNGKALTFSVLVPTSSAFRQSYAVIMQEQYRLVGVKMDVEKLDFPAFVERLHRHEFEAAMDNLTSSPSPSGVRQSWSTGAVNNGGLNFGSYTNPVFDAHVDSALGARDARSAKAHYRAAYQTIITDAPAIWLYEPPQISGAQKRLRTGTLRADAWWLGVPSWSIAAGGRMPRDAPPAKSP